MTVKRHVVTPQEAVAPPGTPQATPPPPDEQAEIIVEDEDQGLRLSAVAFEEGGVAWPPSPGPGDSGAQPLGAHQLLWDQLSSHMEGAERSLKAHHASLVTLLEQHLGPQPAPAPVGIARRMSMSVSGVRRGSVHSLEDRRLRPVSQHRFSRPVSQARFSRPTSQARFSRPSSQPRMPTPTARSGGLVASPVEQETPLPGVPSAPAVARGAETSTIQGARKTPSAKLQLLAIWAERREKRNKGAEGSDEEVVQPLQLIDDEIEPHTMRDAGWTRHVIFHPLHTSRMTWDVISIFLVLYDIIMLPMFFFDLPEDNAVLQGLAWVTRVFWTFDMPMSFVSGFIGGDGVIDLRWRKIVRRYLRSWFILDAIVVSVDWVEILLDNISGQTGVARMGKASRPFRIIRMIRLLRLARMGEVINMLMERLPSDLLVVFGDILKLIVAMLGMGHLIACLWWAVGQATDEKDTWITLSGFDQERIELQYIMSFRWALSQFAGGMDEVVPKTFAEHLYATGIFLVAFWSGTVFLSILTSHMTQLFFIGSQQTQQLSMLRRYLSQHGVSRNLAMRAQRNAQHVMHAQSRTMSEQAVGLMELVSKALRIELHYEMFSPALSMHPFFNDYMQVCPHVVRKICHAALCMSANSQGDVIFHFGETASGMILVKSGSLRYSWGPAKEARSRNVEENSYISEAALWVHWVHRGQLTVVDDSVIVLVNTESFQGIVAQFEQMSFDPSEYAAWFVNKLNETEEDVTDLALPDTEVLPANLSRQSRAITVWKAQSRATRNTRTPGDFLHALDEIEAKEVSSPTGLLPNGSGDTDVPTADRQDSTEELVTQFMLNSKPTMRFNNLMHKDAFHKANTVGFRGINAEDLREQEV